MVNNKTLSLLARIALACACAVISACVKPAEPPRLENPPSSEAAPAAETASSAEQPRKLPPPTSDDVGNAVARIYAKTVVPDPTRFVVGDFNGDGCQDIAVVVSPDAAMLGELNSEVANWILEDPREVVLPDPGKITQPFHHLPSPARVQASDTLLVVVHGFGPDGWRAPESQQTYLLRNAVGSHLRTRRAIELSKIGLLKLRGDVIEENISGEAGFLYYTGAKYAWYANQKSSSKAIASHK